MFRSNFRLNPLASFRSSALGDAFADPQLQQRLNAMRRFQALQRLDWPALTRLAKSAEVIELAAGRCVTRPGRPLSGRWFLLDGVLRDPALRRRLTGSRKRGQAQVYPCLLYTSDAADE